MGSQSSSGHAPPQKRSLTAWMYDGRDLSDDYWHERIANISKHRENLTAISPNIYGISPSGTFSGQGDFHRIVPHLPKFQAMGLDTTPLINNFGGLPGYQRLLAGQAPQAFIKAAVDEAVKMGYQGYNMDSELRGGTDAKSWDFLKPYTQKYMDFLNSFADALHAKNMTLSVDIEACCGWKDTAHPSLPAGHCSGAFADNEFQATTCPMYQQSRLDIVYGMSTYSCALDNTTARHYGPEVLEEMASAASKALGASKYGIGFKGGWNVYNETAKATIRYLRDTLGVTHMSHWNDFPMDQVTWDLWGFFLHDNGDDEKKQVVI